MTKLTRIEILHDSVKAISYDYALKKYSILETPRGIETFEPGLTYFVSIPFAIALGHAVDDIMMYALADLLIDPLYVLSLVLLSSALGLCAGKLCMLVIIRISEKYNHRLRLCKDGEIVESASFILEGIGLFQIQCYALAVVLLCPLSAAFIVLATHANIIMGIFLVPLASIVVVSFNIIQPVRKLRYFVERANVLAGHKISSWFGKLIYWLACIKRN
jgi:hypothetical protein